MAWSVVNLLASPLPVFVTRTQLILWIKIKPSCHGRWSWARRISMHFFCDGNLSSNESWTRTKDGCWYFSDPTDDDLSEVSLCIITRYRLTQGKSPNHILSFFFRIGLFMLHSYLIRSDYYRYRCCASTPKNVERFPHNVEKYLESSMVGEELKQQHFVIMRTDAVWYEAPLRGNRLPPLGNKGVSLHLWHQNSEPFQNGRQITMLKAIWWVS